MCGAIKYEITAPPRDVLHCHCVDCRRSTGNFSASTGCATKDLVVSGEENLRWFERGYARYGFCVECGSSLFWVAEDRPECTSIKIGTLDDATGLPLVGIWFAAEAQPHITFDPNVARFEANDDDGPARGGP